MGSRDSMMRDYEEVDERIDLRHYWNVIRRRKWPILALAFTVSLVAALVALSMTPVYQASATVLIESQQSNVVSIEEVYELDTRSREYYETQVELLKSRPLAADVVETLALASEPEFSGEEQQGGFKLDWLNLDWRSWLPFDPASQAAGLQQNLDPDQQVIAAYSSRLSIEPVRNTQLVRVNFESQQPALAARVANAHAKAYVNSLLAARGDVVGSADEFMTERLGGLEEALQESERRLQEFREREQLVDVEGIRSQPTREINELNSRLVEVRGARSQAEIAYQQVANIDGASPDALQGIPAILDDEVVRRFQEAEGRARQKVAELADRYGPKHPKMIAAQAELAEATKNLRAQQASVATSIRNEYEAARAEEAALRRALGGAQQRYQDVGRKESELNALQREVETNRKLYDLFYTRLSETGATGELEAAPARIASPAVIPLLPARPNRKRIVGLSFALALFGGMMIAFLLESLNNTVRSAEDVREKLQLPLLGMVPLLKAKGRRKATLGKVFFDKTETGFNEAIRTVRTAVSLDNLEKPHKVMLVTSSIGSEGKSTVAMNLAHAFAQSENVLLLDADLRRPSIGKGLDLPNTQPGLVELLAEKANLADCIIPGEKGTADVLLHGSIASDPLELFSSKRFANALMVLRRTYDRIIIDTPPVLPVSDVLVLSKHADTVIFVAKSDATPVRQIKQGLDQLARANARVLGLVVNRLDIRKAEKYSDYGYGGYYESYESGRAAS